ncbi:MAG: ATP-binding cassette domain-containing protein [Defluviitaleaceae bacterium]|nr:ATP-binding cassette domain-containing protein [Defluviitaleaceae bacterium]
MAIEIKNISKSFGSKVVLADFSLVLEQGITCIMGASGKGKTTLINILARLVSADSGEIVMPAGAKISFVFQEDRLLQWDTAIQNVLFPMKRPKDFIKNATELLIQSGLEEAINKKADELSGGMKRRVAICRALIAEHDVLIMDEPFKGLDDELKPRIMDMIKNHSVDKIVLCITHDKTEASYLGGKLVQM